MRTVIAGAGPAGATLAYLLARRGLPVTLLERHRDFAREFRGEVLLPGGLQALQQMGLWSSFDSLPHVKLERLRLFVNGRSAIETAFAPGTFGELQPRWTSQPALLEMLVREASSFDGFELVRGASVTDVMREGGRCRGVRARVDGEDRELDADLVIAADGRTSVLRRKAELVVQRDPIPMDVVWIKVPLPEFLEASPTLLVHVGGGHLLIAAPVYDGSLQIAWVIRKGAFGELRRRGIPACIDSMSTCVGPELAAHLQAHRETASSPFLLSTVSDRLEKWSRPGLLAIGDAAHTMSPVGAQGINIAIRDAIVAANHLVPALENGVTADSLDGVLARIEGERRPEVDRIQKLQARPPRVILSRSRWADWALRIVPLLVAPMLARGREAALAGPFLWGVTEVRLEV